MMIMSYALQCNTYKLLHIFDSIFRLFLLELVHKTAESHSCKLLCPTQFDPDAKTVGSERGLMFTEEKWDCFYLKSLRWSRGTYE